MERVASSVIRMRTGKAVSSPDLSIAAKSLDSLDWEEFDVNFGYELTSEERKTLDYFRENSGRYLISMYTRCILNSRFPESCIIRDKPAW